MVIERVSVIKEGNLRLGQDSNGSSACVIYGSSQLNPDDEEIAAYDGKYICFNALLESGDWVKGGRQLELESPTVPYMWADSCLNEDSYWEASAPDDARCTENDSRTPVAGPPLVCPPHQTEESGQCANPCDDTVYSNDFNLHTFGTDNQRHVLVSGSCVSTRDLSEILRRFYGCTAADSVSQTDSSLGK